MDKLRLRRSSNSSDENVPKVIVVKPKQMMDDQPDDKLGNYVKNTSKKISLTGTSNTKENVRLPQSPIVPIMILPDEDDVHTTELPIEESLVERILSARSARSARGTIIGNDQSRKKSNIRSLSFEDFDAEEVHEHIPRQYLTPEPSKFNRVFSIGGELENIYNKNQVNEPGKLSRSHSSTR